MRPRGDDLDQFAAAGPPIALPGPHCFDERTGVGRVFLNERQIAESNEKGFVVLRGFFDSYVPHGSPANTSNRSRRNIFLTFNKKSDGDNRARYYEDKWRTYPPNAAGAGRPRASFRV